MDIFHLDRLSKGSYNMKGRRDDEYIVMMDDAMRFAATRAEAEGLDRGDYAPPVAAAARGVYQFHRHWTYRLAASPQAGDLH